MNFIRQEPGRRDGSFYYHIGDGYHYKFHSETTTSLYFTCNRSSCRGSALLRLGGAFQHTQGHSHGPDHLYSEVLTARRSIIEQAGSLSRFVTFGDIITSERSRINNRYVRAQLTLRRLRSSMRRARSNVMPNVPENLADLSTTLQDPQWEHLTKTKDFQDNIYLGSVWASDGSHNIVFISKRCLQMLKLVSCIFADGTFYIRPSVHGCYQVFTIVTVHGHTVIPLVWCLMERKSECAYVAVLLLLRAHLQQWSFTRVICDFEDAMINAFRNVFNVMVQGCLFHSADAMARYARTTIGIPVLTHCFEIQNIVKLCCTLPLLPQHLLQRGLDVIGSQAMALGYLYAIVRPYLMYIQQEWLNHPNRGVTLSVCGSFHRTNNASESNNRQMKRKIRVHHPNIFHLLGEFSGFEDVVIDDLYSLSMGITPNRERAVSAVSNDIQIQELTAMLTQEADPSDGLILEYLQRAAYSIQGIFSAAIQS